MAWKLVLFLLSHNILARSEAEALYQDAVAVVAEQEPLFSGEFGCYKTLLLLIEWASRESAGYKHVVGKQGDCGRGQLLFAPARKGFGCDELSRPGTLDLELTLAFMRELRDICGGSVRNGLAAYARGSCHSESGLKIADARLAEIKRGLAE